MGVVGSFGSVVFEVSSQKVRTFTGFTRGGSGRWSDHEVVNLKPLSEFAGPGLEEISFSVRLDVQHGVIPRDELANLREIRDTGRAEILIIGGEPVTWNLWTLQSIQENHKTHTGDGKLAQADVSLTLKEYIVGVT